MLTRSQGRSFPEILEFLNVQTRIISARHSPSSSITGPLLSLPRGHRQTETAPTCGKGPAGGAAFQAPSKPQGAAGATQSCAGAHGAPGDAARDSRAGRRGPSGGVRLGPADSGRHSGRPRGARSPPGAVSYVLPEPPLGRSGARAATTAAIPARTPVRPALSPTPCCPPPHALRVTHPGARQQQRQQHQQQPGRHGEDSGLAPGPAGRLRGAVRAGGLRTGRGRRDDSAAAAGLQQTQS